MTPDLSDDGSDEQLYVDRRGHSTVIETDLGTVTLELDDPKGNEFELVNETQFCDHPRGEQERILWEQALTALQRYHEHYRETYGGD